jgi:hypothetical protein
VLPCLLILSAGLACVNAAAQTIDATWLKLGHYEADGSSLSGWRSAIHSPEFFLHAQGTTDPAGELDATLKAFAEPVREDADKHAQCRFPARYQWLRSTMPAHAAFKPEARVKCPGFDSWTRSGAVSSLSIVYATGYLGNPASYYGHTLLKFNFRNDQKLTKLLDVSVNYGAIVGRDVDPMTYIFKSLTGGYDGGFSHIQFYFHNHNYGDIELRDLWEYKLDLPQDAVDLIVAHAWEVLGKRYTYRFFRLNCAYRMGEILEVAEGVKVIPDNAPWVIPQALIQRVGKEQYRGKPLLAGVHYLPSRQTRFYDKYRNLSDAQIGLLEGVVQGVRTLQDAEYLALTTAEKQRLLDALLDYYQFIGSPLDKASKEIRRDYAKVLAARYQLPPGLPAVKAEELVSPHKSRHPGWFQIGAGHRANTEANSGGTATIRIRPAYYDALDFDSGHVANSALSMGDTQITLHRNRVRLDKFDLFAVDSVNPGLTRLPGDNAMAMKVRIGVEQLRLSCDDCLTARLQSDIGYGRQWSPVVYTAVYVGGALQGNRADQGSAFVRTSADVILKSSGRLGAKLSYEYRFPIEGRAPNYGVGRVEARWKLSAERDIRVSYERDRAEWVNIGVGMYW